MKILKNKKKIKKKEYVIDSPIWRKLLKKKTVYILDLIYMKYRFVSMTNCLFVA